MYYSLIDIIAIFVVFVVNFNVVFKVHKPQNLKAQNYYRFYLLFLMFYFITDMIWGILDQHHLVVALIVDTNIYFLAMVASVLMWTLFEVDYLNEKKKYDNILRICGWGVFLAGVILTVTNIFTPVLFTVGEDGAYHHMLARDILLVAQIIIFQMTAIYALVIAFRNQDEKKTRHIAVAAVANAMSIAILVQFFFPIYPIYAIGCLVGNCIFYAFVVRIETDGFVKEIKERERHEAIQQEEINTTMALAYTDPLTGAKSKHAYVEKEQEIDLLIRDGNMEKFSILIFDLNDLKHINDTKGHDVGDDYIVKTYELIEEFFGKADIQRFGGDEFVLILQGENFSKRYKILGQFNDKIENNVGTEEPIVATGISDYLVGKDNTLRAVFARADEKMYMRTRSLKEMYNG